MRALKFVFFGTACLLFANGALAQTRSSLTGTVTDSSQAVLPGVTVTLDSPGLVGGAQTSTTDQRGVYRFVDLAPETYQLMVSLPGFQSTRRTGLRMLFGTTLTVDISLGVGSATETLTVEGRSPTVDVTTAKSTSKIDADLIANTPTVTDPRNGLELMAMSPGITFRSAFGGARDSNEVLFDGTPTTLPERQGVNAAVINANWLEEIQIVSLGANAEYGEFSGTVANFVTKSGSNDFRGSVDYRKVPGSWVDDNLSSLSPALQTRFSPAVLLTQWDTSAHFGGPLVKDKLFFFTGYQKIRMETQAAGSPGTSGQKQWRALGKLTWAASKNLKVDGAYQHNKVLLKVGPSSVQKPEVGNNNTEPNTVWNTRATWTPQPQTLVEFRVAGLNYEQTIDPAVGGRSGPASHNDVVTGIRSVNGNSYRLLDEKRTIVGASVTRYADNVLGRHHEIKLGVEFDKLSFYSETGFPSGLSFSDRNGVADQVTIWPGDIQEASAKQTKLYLQDGWKITDRVTLEPGLRVTFNRGRTPTAGDVYKTTPVSPRFGVAWDVTKDHKTVARAHYGRYHEALGTVEFQFTDTSRQTVQITARVLGPNNYQELTRFTPAGNQFVDPNIKQPVMDQFLIGVERELFGDFSVNAQYIHRDSKDQYGWLDTRSVYAPVQVRDPGPDNVANTADDGPFITAFNLTTPGVERRLFTNPAGAFRKYNAFQFVVQKRLSKNWQMLAGYTRSKAQGSVNNNIGDNYGSLTVTQSPFINPNNAINATGRNTLDFPHEVIIRGSYHFNILKGFNVGGVYRYTSGQALSRTAVFRLTQGNTTVRVAPRGTLLTDAASSADVRVDKTFPLGKKSRQLSLIMDIYNVNNQGIAAGYTEASGGSFGVPTSWVTARTYQLSGRLTF